MKVQDLDTPAVVVDLDLMEANIARMAEAARAMGVALRPHTKTHKVPEIAKRQLAAGAAGVTVAKVGEAEVMVAAGVTDVFVAYPVVGAGKAERLAALARRGARVSVGLDGRESAECLGRAAAEAGVTIDVLTDLDVGQHRTGVQTADALADLAAFVASRPGLRFAGIMCYPGHVRGTAEEQRPALAVVQAKLEEARDRLAARGLPVGVVSGGSTPTAPHTGLTPAVTEIRPGTYVFNDLGYHSVGANRLEDCALTVHATVVSTSVPGQAVLDSGTKTLTSDRCPARFEGYGLVREHPEAVIAKLNEEHGWVDVTRCPRPPRVGERVSVVPNHVCAVVNMHDVLHGVRGDEVVVSWPIAGRGKVR
jgi:D-serine deaminase-like pyridoxal phosphate-dependent protein